MLWAFSALAHAADACTHLVATGSPDAPPYLWRDPHHPEYLTGLSAELLTQAATELGLTVDILYSGKRSAALEEVRSGRVDLLVDAPMDLSQLPNLDYVHPPLVQNDYLVWRRKDSTLAYRSVVDLYGHPGAISSRARTTQAFQSLASEHLTLKRTDNLTAAFQALLVGEVEYVVAGRYTGLAAAQAMNVTADVLPSEIALDRPGLYLALSHDSACNDPQLREQLALKLTALGQAGVSPVLLQTQVDRWKSSLQSTPPAP